MRCPVCGAAGAMGLLQEYRRGQALHRRYFCRQCCSEVCYEGQALVLVLAIDEEGEVRPRWQRRSSRRGWEMASGFAGRWEEAAALLRRQPAFGAPADRNRRR